MTTIGRRSLVGFGSGITGSGSYGMRENWRQFEDTFGIIRRIGRRTSCIGAIRAVGNNNILWGWTLKMSSAHQSTLGRHGGLPLDKDDFLCGLGRTRGSAPTTDEGSVGRKEQTLGPLTSYAQKK